MHPSASRTLADLGAMVHLPLDKPRHLSWRLSESQTQTTLATEVPGSGGMRCDVGAILSHSRASFVSKTTTKDASPAGELHPSTPKQHSTNHLKTAGDPVGGRDRQPHHGWRGATYSGAAISCVKQQCFRKCSSSAARTSSMEP